MDGTSGGPPPPEPRATGRRAIPIAYVPDLPPPPANPRSTSSRLVAYVSDLPPPPANPRSTSSRLVAYVPDLPPPPVSPRTTGAHAVVDVDATPTHGSPVPPAALEATRVGDGAPLDATVVALAPDATVVGQVQDATVVGLPQDATVIARPDEPDATVVAAPPPDAFMDDDATRTRAAGERAPTTGRQSPWQAGVRVGDWMIVRKLGQGGMGAVFEVEHVESGQRAAIKTILLEADASSRARFAREGQAQAAVSPHIHVLRVRTAGEALGAAYLVMDLATGGDLKARLRDGPMKPLDVARLGRDLARALAHCHRQGVLHRDLKPANVMFDADDVPKLMDFGLARLAGAEKLTKTGTMMGTPAYMSPEQAGGERADERTDVYGLGAVLYHCVTGRPPFLGQSEVAVVKQVLTEAPPTVRSLRADAPQALEHVIQRALEKDPALRYPSAQALADDLERVAKGEPVVGTPRRPGRVALVGLGVVALLAFGASYAFVAGRTREGTKEPPKGGPTDEPEPPPRRTYALEVAPVGSWLVLPRDQAALALHVVADWPEVRVSLVLEGGRAREEVAVTTSGTALSATVPLRTGWSRIQVEAHDRDLHKEASLSLDVVRLPPGLTPGDAPHEVRNDSDGSILCLVPLDAGSAPDERPFFIGKVEATWTLLDMTPVPYEPGEAAPGPDHPAGAVSWVSAARHCQEHGLRLPTRDEWRRAARGGDNRPYPWGRAPPVVPGAPPLANVHGDADGHRRSAPVGSFPAGRAPCGALDMVGNINEYVAAQDKVTRRPWRDADVLRALESGGNAVGGLEFLNVGGSFDDAPLGEGQAHIDSAMEDGHLHMSLNTGFRVARSVDRAP